MKKMILIMSAIVLISLTTVVVAREYDLAVSIESGGKEWNCSRPMLSATVSADSTCTRENHEVLYHQLDNSRLDPSTTRLIRVGEWMCESTDYYAKCQKPNHIARYYQINRTISTTPDITP